MTAPQFDPTQPQALHPEPTAENLDPRAAAEAVLYVRRRARETIRQLRPF